MSQIQSIRWSLSSSNVRRRTRAEGGLAVAKPEVGAGPQGIGGKDRPREFDLPKGTIDGKVRCGPLCWMPLGWPPTPGAPNDGWWAVLLDGKMVPVRPKRSKTVSIGVVNPVGPKPMKPDPEPPPDMVVAMWAPLGNPLMKQLGRFDGEPLSFGKLKAE